MKILVLSLLRIGDIAMSAGVLRDLRARYPEAQIDLLLNKQCSQIAPLLKSVDCFYYFDRQALQAGLGDANTPVFQSYELLNELLDQVTETHYDLAINLTQNRLSGWLMGLIPAKQRIGLVLEADGRASFNSNWFRYMNVQIDQEGSEVFHFNDIFRFALGLENAVQTELVSNNSRQPALVETEAGRLEALSIVGDSKTLVSVQMLTSDTKKDYPLIQYVRALSDFAKRHPDAQLAILAAPFEHERLEPVVSQLKRAGHTAFLAVTSFEGALSVVKRSRLLITLDTSIKHLAAAVGTPVLEICVGSADPYRTGADLQGAIVLQSKEACAPCSHSKACHREAHFCSSRISNSAVALVAGELYEKRTFQLAAIAEDESDDLEILRVDRKAAGFYALTPIAEDFTEANIGRWIDLQCKKLWITGDEAPNDLGTEILKLSRFLKAHHTKVADFEWRHLLEDFERRAMEIEGRINGFKAGLRYLHGTYEDPQKLSEFVRGLIHFREKTRGSALFSSFRKSLDQVIEDDISPAFTRFRHIHEAVSEIEARTQLHLKILRTLTSLLAGEGAFDSQEQL